MYPTQIRNAKLSELVSRIVQCAAALVDDASRNEMIVNDIVHAIKSGRCPLLLTGRTEQRREIAAALAAVPESESRVILATGSYIVKGLTMRVSTRYSWPCRSPGRARFNST